MSILDYGELSDGVAPRPVGDSRDHGPSDPHKYLGVNSL
jgi:hypothetical protein